VQSSTAKAKLDYGPNALAVTSDVSTDQLAELQKEYLQKNILSISAEERIAIEKQTRDQSDSNLWHTERKKRLTCSMYGAVLKRRPTSKVAPLVKQMLYSSFRGNAYTRYGLSQEAPTVQEYVEYKSKQVPSEKIQVRTAGLLISCKHPFLAGSADGIVFSEETKETGLIEVKNLLKNKRLTLSAAVKSVKSFCLTEGPDGQLRLKENHDYYFQCQGLLNTLDFPWLDFVVRCTEPYGLHVERIVRDEHLWSSFMLPKLEAFYMKALLPELAKPREGLSPGIREPGPWVLQTIF
jgi:hypothetical protein